MERDVTHTAPSGIQSRVGYCDRLAFLLEDDLDFHNQDSGYASHNFHSFPAKFPPQLPRKFITSLTSPGDVVLDPMVGSGTTTVEALLTHRHGLGFDIDPLAVLLSRSKAANLSAEITSEIGSAILERATAMAQRERGILVEELGMRWDEKTRQFVDYWFAHETQVELLALIREIGRIPDQILRAFFEVIFSSIIITKSGGVSLAFDLAHTRPHRAKIVTTQSGEVLLGHDLIDNAPGRIQLLTKTLRSPLGEFKRRLQRNLEGLLTYTPGMIPPEINFGDAQRLPLGDASVDLIVTSPPYASNAIDYMRAHKFSLVWMGYSVGDLSGRRKEYIGGETTAGVKFEDLPEFTGSIIARIGERTEKKVRRYYSEMTRVLREMYRVLKPGTAAIVIVGTSVIRGVDIQIGDCLADIGQAVGFKVPKIGIRRLDRNRRMLPAGVNVNSESQIQQRIHEEYVIGFYKSCN